MLCAQHNLCISLPVAVSTVIKLYNVMITCANNYALNIATRNV